MYKEFVPYEEMVELRQLGCDIKLGFPLLNMFAYEDGSVSNGYMYGYYKNGIETILYQQAFDWFRETYQYRFYIRQDQWNNWCKVMITNDDGCDYKEFGTYPTYEEARLACLRHLIESDLKK